MLRILYLVNILAVGGAEIFVLRKIQALRKRGHYAALAFCEKRGEATDHYLSYYLENRDVFRISYDFRAASSLMNKLRPQIVHTTQAHPKFLQCAKQINPNIVCVSSITGDVWPADRKFNHQLYTDAIVTMANVFLPMIRLKVTKPCSQIVVIENGVDTDYFDPTRLSLRESSELANMISDTRSGPQDIRNKKIVLHVGRIHTVKNIEASLEIARKICNVRDDVVFLLAGGSNPEQSDTYFRKLLALRETLNLKNSYFFTGERSDIRDLLSISTCVISTNQSHEGTPNALLEALSMGNPIVALECNGVQDVIRHGSTGFIASNISAATADLLQLLNDDNLRMQMSRASRLYAMDRYNLNSAIEKYESLYHSLLHTMNNSFKRRAMIRMGSLRNQLEEKILTPVFHKS